jgi:hypothetical protein
MPIAPEFQAGNAAGPGSESTVFEHTLEKTASTTTARTCCQMTAKA